MITRKNKCVSMLLAIVMVMTMVFGIIPPVEVHAADGGTGGLKISSPSDGATINGFETIKIKWNRYSGADHYLLVVKDETTGQKVFEEDVSYSTSSTRTYNIYSDDYVFTEDGHEYKIYVVALDENDDELNNGAAWHAIYVTNELVLETPEITSHGYLDTHCVDDPLYVSWDAIDGADDYTVYVKKLNGEPDYDNDNESGTNITSFTWSDDCEIKLAASKLVAGKWYKIAVCATNTDQGIDSDWTSVYILMEESSYLNVSEYPDDLAAEKGSTGSFWIESNMDWDISCDVSWVTWTINQVDDTHAEIIVKATSANTGASDREAEFTISADGVDDEYVYVTQLAPEIELPSFSSVKISGNVSLGEKITWSANVNGNGSLLETVSVGIYSKQLDDSVFFRNVNIAEETYTLSGSVTTGGMVSGYDASGNAKKLDMSLAGEYTVTIHASTDAAFNNYAATNPVTITLTEPVGTGILGDVNSDGFVTNLDRFIFNRYLNSMSGYTANMVNKESADIDGDEELTEKDCIILARHLFGWVGYEDLSAFYIGPSAVPEVDTSEWTMSFSSNAVTIELKQTGGTLDTSKNYLFIAEDSAGLHYTGIIDAGKTSASFGVKALQMSRGEMYSYYVLPEGIVLADKDNKDKYCIGRCAVPLFNGNMITSVNSNEKIIGNGENIYVGNDVTIYWDGSYGVNNFNIVAEIDGNTIANQTYSHSGPGTFVIDGESIEVGVLTITATVVAPSGIGLSNAVCKWSANIIEQPVDEKEYRTELMKDMVEKYFNSTKSFEKYDDLVKDEISIGLFDLVFADITDLGGVVEKVVGGDADVTNAKHTIALLIDNMDDDVYVPAATECADVVVTLYEAIQNTPYDDLRDLFSGVANEAAVISAITSIKQIHIDTVNNSLSQYIEYLFDLGIDDATVMEKYAEVLTWQNNNLSKKNALRKVQKATGTFSKSTKGILDALGTISTVGDVLSILYDAGIKDYSAQLIKLSILEDALENYNYDHLSDAADELRTEMENRLVKLAAESAKYGLEYAVQAASGLWGIVSASVSITVGQDAMAKRDACYLLEIEDALYYHVLSLKTEYVNDGEENTLLSIVQEIHAIADCRVLLNTLGMELNQWGIFVTDKDKYDYFMIYNNWYNNQHKAIDEFFAY